MIDKITNKESENKISIIKPAIMALLLTVQTQTVNALENYQEFYGGEFSEIDGCNKIEELKIKERILKLQLQIQNGNSGNYESNEYQNNGIDFRINGGYIIKKSITAEYKGGLKFHKKKSTNKYRLGHTRITQSNKGDNIYNIHLKSLNRRYNKTIEVEYYGNGEIYSTDIYRNNNIQFKNNTLQINNGNELIILKVDFYRDNNHYNRKHKQHNRNNSKNSRYRYH